MVIMMIMMMIMIMIMMVVVASSFASSATATTTTTTKMTTIKTTTCPTFPTVPEGEDGRGERDRDIDIDVVVSHPFKTPYATRTAGGCESPSDDDVRGGVSSAVEEKNDCRSSSSSPSPSLLDACIVSGEMALDGSFKMHSAGGYELSISSLESRNARDKDESLAWCGKGHDEMLRTLKILVDERPVVISGGGIRISREDDAHMMADECLPTEDADMFQHEEEAQDEHGDVPSDGRDGSPNVINGEAKIDSAVSESGDTDNEITMTIEEFGGGDDLEGDFVGGIGTRTGVIGDMDADDRDGAEGDERIDESREVGDRVSAHRAASVRIVESNVDIEYRADALSIMPARNASACYHLCPHHVASITPVLSLTYAVVVHVFLASFRERTLCPGPGHRFWRMVAVRVVVAALFVVVGFRLASIEAMTEASSSWSSTVIFMAKTILVMSSIGASVTLALRTRRIEVDGPIPPSPENGENSRPLDGVVVFVTGANAGIGLETSRQLYHRGATVILGCRSKSRASDAMRSIDPDYQRVDGDDHDMGGGVARWGPGRLHFVELDLTSFASVREASQALLSTKMPLHVLINNAGVMMRRREMTSDGIETTMAANHLGHFLLTNLLLPKLRKSAIEGPSRVITVSSSLYLNARRRRFRRDGEDASMEPGIDLSDLQCEWKRYSLFEQYAQSKLANVMFAIELGRREKRKWQELQLRRLRDRNVPHEGGNNNQPANEKTSRKTEKKKLRPKLTPVDAPLMDDDELGLGYNDIVPTPPLATKKIISEVKEYREVAEKKKLRPKLTPVDAPLMDDDEFGLGFNDIVPTPPLATKKVIVTEYHEEADKKKLIPVDLSSSTCDDETGLSFHEIAVSTTPQSSPTEIENQIYPKKDTPLLSSNTNGGDGKVEHQHNSTTTKTATINDVEESWALSLPRVMSFCLHPGLVRTNVVRDMPWYLFYPNKIFAIFMALLQKTPHSGAFTSVYCAVMNAKELMHDNECYFVNSEPQSIHQFAVNEDDCALLWELSSKLVTGNTS
ncbi:hypothetical protein ACHAXA_008490 [Cyclostephanos tholiformis]|uniref:Retinol dehydrogenase 13 n=1 Tax=Cyclostephanos tholiformis TaxID=382380 RepID=A0ABD3RCH2_9STRA